MSIKIKPNEVATIPKMTAPPPLSAMNGKKREIEKIRIEDLPEKIDIELQRIESNRNRPMEQNLEIAAAAALIAALAGVCLITLAPTLALGMVISGTIIGSVSMIACMMIYPPFGKIASLRNCREDLKEKEFPAFADTKKNLSEGLTLKEWLHVHSHYEKKKETERKINELVDRLHLKYC